MDNVVWLSFSEDIPARGYWDQSLLEFLLRGCKHHSSVEGLSEAIVVIPGAYQGKYIAQINDALSKLKRCKVIITSDEENNFPIDELKHSNIQVFANYLSDKYESNIHWLPIGPARINKNTKYKKDIDWFFAGQVNHDSRRKLNKVLSTIPNGLLQPTSGFAQGLSREEYYEKIGHAKAVPAPMGNISPDSFRLYEALEAGAVPIAEHRDFWDKLFIYYPFEVALDWEEVEKHIDHIVETPELNNICSAWWQRYKILLQDELTERSIEPTVVIPVSPIKSHPSTSIVDETIRSVRKQLPMARIIVTFDGVREEQEYLRDKYVEFKRDFLLKYNNDNVFPLIFDEHTHQVGMMRAAMNYVATDTLLYVEQDTPLTDDLIAWDDCMKTITTGKFQVVRFHFEAFIPNPHKHMMLDKEPVTYFGQKFMRTCQWSQRPHLASRAFYERILRENFSENAKSFIEDKMHGVCHNAYVLNKQQGWFEYRLAIYHPDGSIKRSTHTDGRAGEAKYDNTQVF